MREEHLHDYDTLLKKFGSKNKIPYSELLLTKEWNNKRDIIINRDKYKCTICNKEATVDLDFTNFCWITRHIYEYTKINENGNEEIASFEYDTFENSDKRYFLHVHHKYYILSKNPWDYPEEALVTLCNWCHWKFHEENIVPVYETEGLYNELDLTPCLRCSGAGMFPEFTHVQNGFCFRCKGLKYEELIDNL